MSKRTAKRKIDLSKITTSQLLLKDENQEDYDRNLEQQALAKAGE